MSDKDYYTIKNWQVAVIALIFCGMVIGSIYMSGDFTILLLLASVGISFLSGLFYGEKETIIKKRWQKPDTLTWADKRWFPVRLKVWWEANNWHYKNKYIDYLMRYPLALLKDGYHFSGTMSVVLLLIAMAIVHSLDGWWVYVMIPINLIWHGIGVNAAYHDWIKEL